MEWPPAKVGEYLLDDPQPPAVPMAYRLTLPGCMLFSSVGMLSFKCANQESSTRFLLMGWAAEAVVFLLYPFSMRCYTAATISIAWTASSALTAISADAMFGSYPSFLSSVGAAFVLGGVIIMAIGE